MEGGRGRNGGTGQNRRLRRENPCWARGRGGHRKARRSSGPGEVWGLRGGSGEVWGLRGGSGGGPRDSLRGARFRASRASALSRPTRASKGPGNRSLRGGSPMDGRGDLSDVSGSGRIRADPGAASLGERSSSLSPRRAESAGGQVLVDFVQRRASRPPMETNRWRCAAALAPWDRGASDLARDGTSRGRSMHFTRPPADARTRKVDHTGRILRSAYNERNTMCCAPCSRPRLHSVHSRPWAMNECEEHDAPGVLASVGAPIECEG